MTALTASILVLGGGLWFLGFRLLFIAGWKDKPMGLLIIATGTVLVTSGSMMIAHWGQ